MFRPSVFNPMVRARPLEPTFRRDDDAFRIGIQGLGDDSLADIGPVRIRGVDEIDPEFDGASHDANSLTPIRRFAPDSLTGETHRTKCEPSKEEIDADQK